VLLLRAAKAAAIRTWVQGFAFLTCNLDWSDEAIYIYESAYDYIIDG